MRFLMGCCMACLLVACGKKAELAPAAISELYIADFISEAPDQCGPSDVDLSNNDVLQFFRLAREVEHKTLHDHYNYAPCAIEGTLKYQQQSCSWQVRAGATGYIKCAERYRYFACDNCAELFSTEKSRL